MVFNGFVFVCVGWLLICSGLGCDWLWWFSGDFKVNGVGRIPLPLSNLALEEELVLLGAAED